MKNPFLVPICIMLACMITLVILTPVEVERITIVKSEIVENRPFAGVINDEYVGSEICLEYVFAFDKCADTAVYEKHQSLLGVVHCMRDVTPQTIKR